MNIDNLSDNVAARRMTTPKAINQPAAREIKAEPSRKDSVATSDWSKLISNGIAELTSLSAARTDKIRQFAAQVEAPVNISGNAIHSIFRKIV